MRTVDQHTLDLEALVAKVKADRDWFLTIDAELLDVLASPLDGGIVELSYTSASQHLDQLIRDRYGAPELLLVERAGGPPWTGPVGDLVIRVTYPDGRPGIGLSCVVGGGDPLLTRGDGTCRFEGVAALAYRIEIWSGVEEQRRVVGSALVTVAADQTTSVNVVAAP